MAKNIGIFLQYFINTCISLVQWTKNTNSGLDNIIDTLDLMFDGSAFGL